MLWASVSRDIMQKVVEHLFRMNVLYGIQWASLKGVCRQWRHCVDALLKTLPSQLTDSATYRVVLVGARRYLEVALLRNYPHRIHALSNMSSHAPKTFSALAYILHQGCGINIFQLPIADHRLITVLQFLGMYPSVYNVYSFIGSDAIRTAMEDYTGDLFIFVSCPSSTLDVANLCELEDFFRTKDGQSIFVWHSYSIHDCLDHKKMHKRNFETRTLHDNAFVFIFRNRTTDASHEFDHENRKDAKGLRTEVARKRSRPKRNPKENSLIRLRLEQGAEIESSLSDDDE